MALLHTRHSEFYKWLVVRLGFVLSLLTLAGCWLFYDVERPSSERSQAPLSETRVSFSGGQQLCYLSPHQEQPENEAGKIRFFRGFYDYAVCFAAGCASTAQEIKLFQWGEGAL